VPVVVLFVAIGMEGFSFRTAVRESNKLRGSRSWLRFVRTPSPELVVDLGTFEVPVPLRRFPESPDLVLQSATPTHPQPRTLAEVLRWSYRVEYRQREIAQDRLVLDADYNVREEAHPARAEAADGESERPLPRSLFEALARWSAESPALWAHAPSIAAAADGDEGKKVEALAVIARFTDLVRGAAVTWETHHPVRATSLAAITDRYWLEDEEGGELIRVRRFRGTGFPVWPGIAGYAPVDPPPAEDAEDRLYRRLPGKRKPAKLAPEVGRALTFPGHRLAERQNALGLLRIVRNARLSDERKTNPAFIYETAAVSFVLVLSQRKQDFVLQRDAHPVATIVLVLAGIVLLAVAAVAFELTDQVHDLDPDELSRRRLFAAYAGGAAGVAGTAALLVGLILATIHRVVPHRGRSTAISGDTPPSDDVTVRLADGEAPTVRLSDQDATVKLPPDGPRATA